jgi:transposase-like protein
MLVLHPLQNPNLLFKNDRSVINTDINPLITAAKKPNSFPTSRLEERQILDLLLGPLSINRVARHVFHVFKEEISIWKIRRTLLDKKSRIETINHRFDQIAARKLKIVQIDETFKGQKVSILVVIDSVTGYIIKLEWLPNRSKKAILAALEPIAPLLRNGELILTDGAPYFPDVIAQLCPGVSHQICLVHVMRELYNHLKPSKTAFQDKLKTLQDLTSALKQIAIKKKKKRYKRKKLRQKLHYWKKKRKKRRKYYGVVPYQKGILQKYPELRKINKNINYIRASLRSLEHTIERLVENEENITTEQQRARTQKNKIWGQYMIKCRLLHRFYKLFQLRGDEFTENRSKLLTRLKDEAANGCTLSKELKRVLTEVKHVDSINQKECPVQLSLNFINTNAIESINSRLRPYLEGLRKITNSEYCRTYFKLLRLYLNTTRPFSGDRNDTSPIERYGYDLRGRNYLDLIFNGLPPGPQYTANLQTLNLQRAAPTMVGKCNL